MFNAMMRYRLTAIWKTLAAGAFGFFGGMVVVALIFIKKGIDFGNFGLTIVTGFLFLSQITLIVQSFTTTRKTFNFAILNGIPRKISFLTQLVSLFSSQLVTFAILYPIAIHNQIFAGIKINLLDPHITVAFILVVWTFIAQGLAISSFLTLFERKAWVFLFAAWLIIATVYERYITPIITRMLPDWTDYFFVNFEQANVVSAIKITFDQPNFWISTLTSIVAPLIIAGICQHFMQTRRITFRLKKFAR